MNLFSLLEILQKLRAVEGVLATEALLRTELSWTAAEGRCSQLLTEFWHPTGQSWVSAGAGRWDSSVGARRRTAASGACRPP
ncbi:hypothetical protein DLE60_13600 [Micromonospora globispora]|uniref:hypothetical protein n=1 Tax=Micromonospora globispora TaxID=1450148 RepID=UPI000D702507|nr:hypothetical protein [Micromonospora globispora]PWU59964.1 hypothetical protein DLE60_13600 [Micromonospora globispora]